MRAQAEMKLGVCGCCCLLRLLQLGKSMWPMESRGRVWFEPQLCTRQVPSLLRDSCREIPHKETMPCRNNDNAKWTLLKMVVKANYNATPRLPRPYITIYNEDIDKSQLYMNAIWNTSARLPATHVTSGGKIYERMIYDFFNFIVFISVFI